MKLYHHPASPFARKPRIAAHLLGIELETQMVDLFSGEGQSPEFLALNPNGKVPTLQDGDFVLWESNAIVQYIAAKAPESPLFPRNLRTQADLLRWQFWEASSWAPACTIFVYEHVLKPIMGAGEPDPAELAKGAEKFHRCAKALDGHLAERPWLLGDELTLADVSVSAVMMYAESAHYPVSDYPRIQTWFAKIRELPAWQATEPPAA